MRCEECLPVIEEYFDGELDGQRKEAVRLHLDNCGACAAALRELVNENQTYCLYERSVEVRPELWARVRAGITEERIASAPREGWRDWVGEFLPGPRLSVWLTAAMIVVAIGLTITVMKYLQRPGEEGNTVSSAVNAPEKAPSPESTSDNEPKRVAERISSVGPSIVDGRRRAKPPAADTDQQRRPVTVGIPRRTRTPNQLVREAEQKYLAAIAMLSRNVNRKRSRLDSATLAKWDQALTSIDRTIAGTREAVRRHPNDPVAVQYMLTAYSRKVDVLREMVDY